jgi:hypothetical protein
VPEGPPIRTRHADLSLEQVAEALPGTGELMRSVGHCFAMAWHAAHGGNWELGAYYFRRSRSLLRGLAVVRPKYADQVREFDRELLEEGYAALLERDLGRFDAAFAAATAKANGYHVETGHPYIRWRVPRRPPDGGVDLDG